MCAAEPHVHTHRNVLKITFSPEQSMTLTMWVKEPGFDFKLHERELVLASQKGEMFRSPEAYERVLYDCIVGDQTRFVSGAEVVAAWNFITPILESFKNIPLHQYPKGSNAPMSNKK
jgi:glucose-6-phosphate 1-dehydrogenase